MKRRDFIIGAVAAAGALKLPRTARALTHQQLTVLNGAPLRLPSGAVGLWYADQYQTSPRAYVPNSAAVTGVSKNLSGPTRRLFAGPMWTRSNITATDDFAAGPDGLTEASRLQWSAGVDAVIYPAFGGTGASLIGQYTVAFAIKSNTGLNQTCRIGDLNGTLQTITVTSSWQRFSATLTNPTNNGVGCVRSDGTTAGDILVCDAGIYAGSSDLGPDTLAGHLLLGGSAFNLHNPPYSNGVLDFSGNVTGRFSFSQFPTQTLSSVTIMAVGSKLTNLASFSWAISDAVTFTNIGRSLGHTQDLGDFNGGNVNAVPVNSGNARTFTDNLWSSSFNGLGWSVEGYVYDGTNDLAFAWIDDIKFTGGSLTKSAVSIADFFIGCINTSGNMNPGDFGINALAIWNRALSDTEYRQAYNFLASRAKAHAISIAPKRILIAEGDSITAGTIAGPPYPAVPAFSPACLGFNNSVSGSTVATMTSRASALDSLLPTKRNGRKFILSVLIGRNDLANQSVATFLSNLSTYLDARRAAGWYVVLCTILPSTAAGFNANRDSANTTMKTWVGMHCDAICDFAADPTMGIDGNGSTTGPWNTTYYADGTHPTTAGQSLLSGIYATAINAI